MEFLPKVTHCLRRITCAAAPSFQRLCDVRVKTVRFFQKNRRDKSLYFES